MSRAKVNRAPAIQSKPIPTVPVVKGTHLTIITHPDGKQSFIWDWDALLLEVKQATENYEKSKIQPTKKRSKNDIKKS